MEGKKILFLTPQLPYPPHQGTTIRNYNLIANLAARHEIHLLSFVYAHDELSKAVPLRRCCCSSQAVLAPQRSSLQRLLSVFFSPLPDMALRLPSEGFRAKLVDVLRREAFDVIQIEGIEMAQYGLWLMAYGLWRMGDGHHAEPTATNHRPVLVFDDHNAEYVLQQRAFETDVRCPGRWSGALYSLIQWRKLSRYEREICLRADRVVVVSQADKEALLHLVPNLKATVIPNGVDIDYYRPDNVHPLTLKSCSLIFTGKMDFRPNIDAVLWFCQEVLPLVQAEVPEVHFYIVGQRPHHRILPLTTNPAVTITGYVNDVRPYIAGAEVYVVPLRIGGGTRLKVMEAMAMSKAIVSTSLGCEGFKVTDGQQLIVADTPHEFARRVIDLLGDARARERLGQTARRFVERRYDWRLIVPKFDQVYE